MFIAGFRILDKTYADSNSMYIILNYLDNPDIYVINEVTDYLMNLCMYSPLHIKIGLSTTFGPKKFPAKYIEILDMYAKSEFLTFRKKFSKLTTEKFMIVGNATHKLLENSEYYWEGEFFINQIGSGFYDPLFLIRNII